MNVCEYLATIYVWCSFELLVLHTPRTSSSICMSYFVYYTTPNPKKLCFSVSKTIWMFQQYMSSIFYYILNVTKLKQKCPNFPFESLWEREFVWDIADLVVYKEEIKKLFHGRLEHELLFWDKSGAVEYRNCKELIEKML